MTGQTKITALVGYSREERHEVNMYRWLWHTNATPQTLPELAKRVRGYKYTNPGIRELVQELEDKGWLKHQRVVLKNTLVTRVYTITPAGEKQLNVCQEYGPATQLQDREVI
jgi:hypothetical protein